MALDPFTEKRVGNADFECVAFATQSQTHTIAEPAAKPHLAQPLGNRRAQSGFFDSERAQACSQQGLIFRGPGVSSHGAIFPRSMQGKLVDS